MNLWEQLERLASDAPPSRQGARVAYHAARIGIALLLAVATFLLFPSAPAAEVPLYEIGAVAPKNVIAPFAFEQPKSTQELEREREQLARTAQPVFTYTPAALDTARGQAVAFMRELDRAAPAGQPVTRATVAAVQRVSAAFGLRLSPAEASYLAAEHRRAAQLQAVLRAFERWLAGGVASSGELDNVRGDVTLRRGAEERTVMVDAVVTFSMFLSRAQALQPDPGSELGTAIYRRLLTAFFHPTLALDRAATERRREELRQSVPVNRFEVRAGEKIIGAHEVVGREEYEKLRTLQQRSQRAGQQAIGRVVGSVLFNFLVILIFGIALLLYRPQLYGSLRALSLFALVFLLVLTGAALIAHGPLSRPELVPVALAAVLCSVLFDSRISMIAAMVLAVLVGSQTVFRGTNALFLTLVGGAAAAFSVRIVRRRNQAYYSIVTVAAAYLFAAVALGLTLDWSWDEVLRSAAWGGLNAVIAVPLAMVLLPLAEELTGIDTYLKLLEWSDLNRPLMQRLSLEAPGTYNHTVFMANLAESAANAIGANGLLARVGAYYHDIGKLKKPQYFVENQPKGRNPHDKLKPSTSASIIRSHIREGLELADEYRLPRAIRAFITEHHGTGSISYFYEKAKERDGTAPNPAEFAYPGPLPQTAETAIVMLADGVEAATRVISEPTPQRIREVIDHIVRQRIDQGQLRDAPLTLRQLEIIKEQFARILVGQYHNRIDYPASGGGVSSEFAAI